ncbi:MAG: L-ascorbate metabolism protein UlaG (beta-lactamase superfamily) [Candidatus Azotimanducaceae bacterium]|jgi:L-ascorbate metabolism protein UlaG (beta-lactamase superfamily)
MNLKTISYLGVLVLLTSCFAGPIFQGDDMKNFDGTVFHNRTPMYKSPYDLMRLGTGALSQSKTWPKWRQNEVAKIPAARVTDGIVVTYINHATTLIQVNGINILTDPIYSERASPLSFAGPKRVRAPGIAMTDLPEIDVILISHNHYDHLDTATLKQLAARQQTKPLILSGLGVGKLLNEIGLNRSVDMQWGQTESLGEVEFAFVECRHRSGRGITDQMKTLWGSFVINTPSGAIYFAGDTGYGPHLKEHGKTFGPFELTILPIGAYEPRWFMADVHLNPAEAVQAHLDLNSKQSLGIHFGVFQLTYEGVDDPIDELNVALEQAKMASESFWTLEPGDARQVNTSDTLR